MYNKIRVKDYVSKQALKKHNELYFITKYNYRFKITKNLNKYTLYLLSPYPTIVYSNYTLRKMLSAVFYEMSRYY